MSHFPSSVPDFRLFRFALASAEHGSFRKAAAALNTQQSSVSRGVRSLERHIGAALFERSPAGIRPTPAGERFLREAALGFDHLGRAVQEFGVIQRGEEGELTVAASAPFSLLGDVLGRFRDQHPGVTLEIVEGTCSTSVMLVQQRKAEMAFISKLGGSGALQSLHLRHEPLTAVVPTSHKLATAKAVTIDELRTERFILGAGGLGPAIAEHLKRHASGELCLQSLRMGQCDLIDMVGRGFGITVLVGGLPHAAPSGVAVVPFGKGNSVPIHALWMPSSANPALRCMLKLVERTLSFPRRGS